MNVKLPSNGVENNNLEAIPIDDPLPFAGKFSYKPYPAAKRKPRLRYSIGYCVPEYQMDRNHNVIKFAIIKQRQDIPKQGELEDISLVLTIPVDLMVEIFEWLHPLDLYHIGMTCRPLRRFIYSEEALWEASCNITGVPTRPPDCTYRQWSNFLFGLRTCKECGEHAGRPDFAFQRHICSLCLNKNYYARDETFNDPLMYTLTLETRPLRRNWSRVGGILEADDFGRRRTQDIEDLEAKLKELRSQAGGDETLAAEIVSKYAKQHQEHFLSRMKGACLVEEWAWGLYVNTRTKVINEVMNRLNKVKIQLFKQGFIEGDLGRDFRDNEIPRSIILENQHEVWLRILSRFIEIATQKRAGRLRRPHYELKQRLRKAFIESFAHYRHNRPASEWWGYPSVRVMIHTPAINTLLMDPSPSEELLKDEGWAKTLVGYGDFFEEWRKKKIAEIKMAIPEAMRSESESGPASLDRAALVFACTTCTYDNWFPSIPKNCKPTGNALFGITEARQHTHVRRCNWDEDLNFGYSVIEFNERAACAVRSLLELLELGKDASVKDIDAVNARIICYGCPQFESGGLVGSYAMTWRECVVHTIETVDSPNHNVPKWHLLTSEAKAYVIHREPHEGRILDKDWICTLCDAHHIEPEKRSDALRHVVEVHAKRLPVVGVDVVYYPGDQYTTRKPLFVPTPPGNIMCKICHERKRRFMNCDALGKHFRDSHGIASGDINWEEHSQTIQIIERSI